MTPGTVDFEVYERCLLRIGVFSRSIGGCEEILGSIARELEEETGLKALDAAPGEWIAIFDELRLCLAKVHRFDLPAEEIAGRASAYLADAEEDELAGVEIIRSRSQIDSRMPGYAAEIVRHFLGD